MRIAFYAPLKSPDHPVPSGDRLMARLLIEAMRLAGHTVFVASRFRGYASSPEEFAQRRSAGEAAASELVARWRDATPAELFFCYHPYYKAPDFLGPRLSATFGIPYVTAEASFSSRRRIGPWAAAQEVVEQGAAPCTPQSLLHAPRLRRACSGSWPRTGSRCSRPSSTHRRSPPPRRAPVPPRLITVAMMRPGDKLESYRMLAAALGGCLDLPWTLTIVGDGPCRDEVRSLFSRLPSDRVDWLGERRPDEVPAYPGGRDHLCLARLRRSLRPCLSGSAGRGPSGGRAGCRRRSRGRARWHDGPADTVQAIFAAYAAAVRAAAVRSRLARRNGQSKPGGSCLPSDRFPPRRPCWQSCLRRFAA